MKIKILVDSISLLSALTGIGRYTNEVSNYLKEDSKFEASFFYGYHSKNLISKSKKSNVKNLKTLIVKNKLLKNIASLFVYPSFYEGFGLPPLESMACGTPVICSSTTSLPEVGGDAVIYCDPYDIEDIKFQIELVLNDKVLQKDMIKNGLERVKQFTWEKSANKHMQVFEELINEKE